LPERFNRRRTERRLIVGRHRYGLVPSAIGTLGGLGGRIVLAWKKRRTGRLGGNFLGLRVLTFTSASVIIFSNDTVPSDRLLWVGRGGSLHVNMTSFSGCHFSV
jgi:hypothetical protein